MECRIWFAIVYQTERWRTDEFPDCVCAFSSMFGRQLDIHSGGIDLAFPHHENEIAQSEAYHQCGQWANYFLHSGKSQTWSCLVHFLCADEICSWCLDIKQTLSETEFSLEVIRVAEPSLGAALCHALLSVLLLFLGHLHLKGSPEKMSKSLKNYISIKVQSSWFMLVLCCCINTGMRYAVWSGWKWSRLRPRQDFLQSYSANEFRMFCLLSKYRSGETND